MPDPLFVDDKTTRELEIFQSRDAGPSAFALLDRTRTEGGRRALQARFVEPLSERGEILRVQDAVRYLMRTGVTHPIDEALVRSVRHYLDSRWAVSKKPHAVLGVIESLWVAIRYPDYYQDVRRGAGSLVELIRRVRALMSLGGDDLPPVLAGILLRMSDLLQPCEHVGLPSRMPWRAMALDRELRRTLRPVFEALLEATYDLDALCSMAHATEIHGFAFPEIADSTRFVLEGTGIFHPFTTNPVGNPVALSGGETLVFLTGPNMAGKTTYLRAIGLATYLAHVGMGVPATSLRISPLQALFTSLSPEDNLRAGLSYYMAEVRRVREMLEGLTKRPRALVIVDEVFKGTNVHDAVEASRLVILGFCRVATAGFVVSSHLAELAEELRDQPSIRFAYLDGQIRDGHAEYGYTVREGVSIQRLGLHLLEQEGVPELLTSLAS